ncbi:MAG: murein biosynthesis integral membrane protein MurJ [Phycisphaerae bacterium]
MDDKQHREREGFFGAAKLVAGLTLLSRVMGMVRDIAITSLGATRANAAFVMAFQIPNLFRRLFGEGALAGAFVPVFTETGQKSGPDKAARLLANALGLLAVFLLALMLLIEFVLLVWSVVWPGEADRQLLIGLTAVMLPFMVTICLLALGSAALNCRKHFAYPAAAPMILNVLIIAAAVAVERSWEGQLPRQLYVIAASVTAAGIVQLAGVIWMLRRSGLPTRPRLRPVEPGIRPMLRLMAPMLLGLGFLQISPFFDSIIIWVFTASEPGSTNPLAVATQVQVYAAQRLYQFPMGVLAISLGVAVFPLLSLYAAREDIPSLRDSVNRAIRLSIMEGLATGTGMFVLAEPITRLIFRHGDFHEAQIPAAAFVLQMYCLGMWAYCAYQIFSRAFYAMKDTKTPLKVSCALMALNMALVVALIWTPLKAGAFGAATSLTASMSVVILAVILRRRLGRIGAGRIAVSIGRTVIACGAMAVVVAWLMAELRGATAWIVPNVIGVGPMLRDWVGLGAALHGEAAKNWVVVAVCVPSGAAVFFLTAWFLRAPELGELFGALRRARPAADLPA